MRAKVVVKIGDVSRTSQTQVPVADPDLQLGVDASFHTLREAVEDVVTRALLLFDTATTRVDERIYLRPSINATQRELVELTATNYEVRVAAARAVHEKRRGVVGPFVCEIYVFVVRRDANGSTIRRATGSRIAASTTAVNDFRQARPDIQVGDIATAHWVVSHARQAEGSVVDVPTSATFRQMQHLDAMRARQGTPSATEPEFGSLTARFNGSSDFVLSVNIRQLRQLLGLPSHNLLAEGIFSAFIPPEIPAEDVRDVDHESDDETM